MKSDRNEALSAAGPPGRRGGATIGAAVVLSLVVMATACAGDGGMQQAGHSLKPKAPPPSEPRASVEKPDPQNPDPRSDVEPELPPPSAGPILDDELQKLRWVAQGRVLGRSSPEGEEAWPYSEDPAPADPAAYRKVPPQKGAAHGHWVPIEGESSLEHFHEALRRLEAGEKRKVRVLAYGASHTQADGYTAYLRQYLQARFGNGGQGFVHLGRVNKWYRTADSKVSMHLLRVRHAQSLNDQRGGALGLFGADAYSRTPGSYGEVTLASMSQNTRFEVHYLKHLDGGDFRLLVDGELKSLVKTRAEEEKLGYFAFEAAPGKRVIRARLTGMGTTRLLGLTAETKDPGVVVDTLGIGGARMSSQLMWDEGHWAEAVKHRSPDLVTFAYGTNESMETHKKIETYEAEVRDVLARLRRTAPQVSCLLIGPFDFAKKQDGRYLTRARLLQVIDVQRRVAREANCGFWDGYAFMGGNGSMNRWAKAHPPMAKSDRLHLTPLGYVAAGIAIGDALMRKYDALAEATRK